MVALIVIMKRDEVAGDRVKCIVVVHGTKRAIGSIEEYQQLLPGIPDEVTIDKIAPKLPWVTFHSLASVSHGWLRAIQSHQIYNARVRSRSTQMLVALAHKVSNDFSSVALYSMEDGSCHRLPPIPRVDGGGIGRRGCVFLDGKLYIMGGMFKSKEDSTGYPASAEVYVMDLAGMRKWKCCTSMKEGRQCFGCCAKNGQIYVFGGHSGDCDKPVFIFGSEVYDPKEDTWSSITAMPSFGFGNKVTIVGEELFVHDGQVFQGLPSRPNHVKVAAVYNPLKDEWRTIKDFIRHRLGTGLMVGEKLYNLSHYGIEVYDMDAGTWNDSEPIRIDAPIPHAISVYSPLSAVAMDNEIFALARCNTINHEGRSVSEKCLIRSQGLGSTNQKIKWQKLHCSMDLRKVEPFMCPIQL